MTGRVRIADDPYADGWDAGYLQALVDLASESDRIHGPRSARELIERLRCQHITAGPAGVIR